MKGTIAAIATAASGPIGIIRVSGDDAISIVSQIFIPFYDKKIADIPYGTMIYGGLKSRNKMVIDSCLAVFFKGPKSYTGEDMVEIHCHGALSILNETLTTLFSLGVLPAQPGEFTKRAFLNGKMDLSEAEAVHDIISASTIEAASNAVAQVNGKIGRKVQKIRDEILEMVAHFYALVDYPDEDIDPFIFKEARELLYYATKQFYTLAESFEKGKILKEGISCVILGKPNVGKSSLLNALSGTEKAIVTDIAGTTRDLIEESIKAGPVLLRVTDTAGLRETSDVVEKIGVEKALEEANGASLILAVFDLSRELNDEDLMVIARTYGKKSIAIINKSDLENKLDLEIIKKQFTNIVYISAKTHDGINELFSKITEIVGLSEAQFNGDIVTNARQAAALTRAAQRCEEAFFAAETGMTPDAVVMDAEGAIAALGEITGQTVHEEIVSKIFENFCVGK